MKQHIIEHLGKQLKTKYYANIPDEKCNEIRELYYQKPDYKLVENNFRAIHAGGTKVTEIVSYYLKDLMSQVKLYNKTWSIAEGLQSNDIIRHFYARVQVSPKVYPLYKTLITNIETAFRIGGSAVGKPSNFPMQTVDTILETYNVNNRYYDFSCGWGVRMLSALKHNIEYYGTDPNHELVDRLRQIYAEYIRINNVATVYNDEPTKIDIRCQGSEIFIPEWKNTIGVAFTSPPYFILEDYKFGNQSIQNRNYDTWLSEYMLPTIQNIKEYLVQDGYILINIKNFAQYPLYDDTFQLVQSCGFNYVDTLNLKIHKRPSIQKNGQSTDENIMVFRK